MLSKEQEQTLLKAGWHVFYPQDDKKRFWLSHRGAKYYGNYRFGTTPILPDDLDQRAYFDDYNEAIEAIVTWKMKHG